MTGFAPETDTRMARSIERKFACWPVVLGVFVRL